MPLPRGPSVAPPKTLAADCSEDVSKPFRKWLRSLPTGQTVVVPTGACYLVDKGVRLHSPKNLTIYGGTFMDKSNTPSASAHSKGSPIFTVFGGSGLTLEAMRIVGVNPGGYHPNLAFAGRD